MVSISILIASLVGSYAGTRFMIGYARRQGQLDVPNQRSSHTMPTPRGGGIAIVFVFTLAMIASFFLFPELRSWLPYLTVSSLAVAWVGWLDDRKSLPASVRLLVHLGASLVFVLGLSPGSGVFVWSEMLKLSFGFTPLLLIESVLLISWLLNLYNFMDGIDGIAGGEAVTVALGSAAIAFANGRSEHAWLYCFLAASVCGFLILNWAPARIFMGDVGSGFLGFCFGALLLVADRDQAIPLIASLILLGVFIVDATYTLIRRAVAGKSLAQAHREHAYQYASRTRMGHRGVTSLTIAINVLWLTPLAFLSIRWPEARWAVLALAYFPLVLLAGHLKAGVSEN